MEGILKITKFPRAHIFGLRRDGTGRRVAGASFEEVSQGSLCEAIRARHMIDNALRLHVSEEVRTCNEALILGGRIREEIVTVESACFSCD